MDLFIGFLYFVVLVGSSYCFHRRYGCAKASLLSGIVTSAIVGAIVECFEAGDRFSLESLVGVVTLAVIFGSLFSACLSALIGAAVQHQKK